MVPRWSAVLHAKLQYREGGGLRAINVRLAANALQLCFTPQAMRTWLSLRANAMHYLQHRRYRRRRPQVPCQQLFSLSGSYHATAANYSRPRLLTVLLIVTCPERFSCTGACGLAAISVVAACHWSSAQRAQGSAAARGKARAERQSAVACAAGVHCSLSRNAESTALCCSSLGFEEMERA